MKTKTDHDRILRTLILRTLNSLPTVLKMKFAVDSFMPESSSISSAVQPRPRMQSATIILNSMGMQLACFIWKTFRALHTPCTLGQELQRIDQAVCGTCRKEVNYDGSGSNDGQNEKNKHNRHTHEDTVTGNRENHGTCV